MTPPAPPTWRARGRNDSVTCLFFSKGLVAGSVRLWVNFGRKAATMSAMFLVSAASVLTCRKSWGLAAPRATRAKVMMI